MSKKLAALSSLLVFSVSSASAQVTDDFTGVIPLIFQIIGINPNPVNTVGLLATFGLMSVFSYIFFKTIAENAPYLDSRNLTGGGGRNLLAIFSVLFTVSGVAGAKSLGLPLMAGWQGMIVLFFAFALLAALAMVVLGGGGIALGSIPYGAGTGLRAAGKGTKAGLNQVGIDSDTVNTEKLGKGLKKAGNFLGIGEESMEEGEWEDAEEAFEQAIDVLEDLEAGTAEGIQNLNTEIEDSISNLQEALEDERQEGDQIIDMEQRIKRIFLFLDTLLNMPNVINTSGEDPEISGDFDTSGNLTRFLTGDLPTDFVMDRDDVTADDISYEGAVYGAPKIQEDVEAIQNDLQMIQGEFEEEESDVVKAFKELQDAAVQGARVRLILNKLRQELNELEQDSEKMEKIEQKRQFKQLYQATEEDEAEEKEMEEALQDLEEMENELKAKVEEAWTEMENFLSYDEEEIEELQEELQYEERLQYELEQFRRAAANSGYTNLEDRVGTINDEISTINNELQQVLDEMSEEERSIASGLKNMLGKVRSSGDGGFAGDMAEEMEDWLGSSSVTA